MIINLQILIIVFRNVTLHNQVDMYCQFHLWGKREVPLKCWFLSTRLNDVTATEIHCCGELQMSQVAGTFQEKMQTFAAKAKTRPEHLTHNI